MFFKQYYLGCLAHASYLIADEKTKTGIVVDPQRDIAQYLQDAKANEIQIKHVFLTHFHADFIAGHLELRDQVGAIIHLGAKAQADFDFVQEKEGHLLDIGNIRIETLETPGHTPEGISILVFDLNESTSKPKMVLTGDTLFIGDVGRPDLMASVGITALELAEMLYDSLRNKLMPLPDETLVYPAHGAGSLCGRNMSDETVSTIGDQKKLNYALQPMSLEEFVAIVTENQPEAPQYFSYDAQLNKQERQTLDDSLKSSLKELGLTDVLTLQEKGYQILDTRPDPDFNASHLKGAIGIALGGKFATWCGVVLKPDIPIIIVAESGAEYESEMRLGRIGFDNVYGYLDGGMKSLIERTDLTESIARWTPQEFADKIGSKEPTFILDVRSPVEYSKSHVKGAANIPLNNLTDESSAVSLDKEILVYCAGGYRSTIACSLLQKSGFRKIANLLGGIAAIEKNIPDLIETSTS